MRTKQNNNAFDIIEYSTIREALEASCNRFADKTAFILKHKSGKSVSYEHKSFSDFLQDIYAFSVYLASRGYANATVAITGINSYEWLIAHFGAIFAGHVSVPIDKELKAGELQYSLEESRSNILVYDMKSEKKVLEVLSQGSHNVDLAICTADSKHNTSIRNCIEEGRKLMAEGVTVPFCAKDPDDLVILLFTSGTTANAKAVMLSNRNIASNLYGLHLHLGNLITPEDVNLAFLPFHHSFGITGVTLLLYYGVTNVFCDGLKHLADNLVEYKVSLFITVPLLLEAMQKKILKAAEKSGKLKLLNTMMPIALGLKRLGIDVRRKIFRKSVLDQLGGALRLAVVGAAPIDASVGKFYDALGILSLQGYGLTETSPVLAAENPDHKKPGSIGIPLPNVTMEIDRPDADGLGEIIAKAPNVMLGYTKDEYNSEVFENGWFHTGDLGYKDEDGFFYVKGRKKNVIVLKNGKNVYPEELEELLSAALPEVSELLVFGWNKGDDLLVSCNFVVDPALIDKLGEAEIKNRLLTAVGEINKTLPPYKLIKRLLLSTEEMEKTTTAKIKRPAAIAGLQKRTDYF